MTLQYTIGEFSRITGLTVKTLRFYHEQGVLDPSCIDDQSGYRYYGPEKIERARVISVLRDLEFSLNEIAEILSQFGDDSDLCEFLERRRSEIQTRLKEFRRISRSLDQIISREQEAKRIMQTSTFEVEIKNVEPVLVAGLRMRGKYSDCGSGFGRLGRRFGRHINGKAMMLCYDQEFRADEADFEVCMPIRKGESDDDFEVRELAGGQCITLMHKGPYDEISRSYAQIFEYAKKNNLEVRRPTREVYLKGPGMIFKGNPKKYLTEIQMFFQPNTSGR